MMSDTTRWTSKVAELHSTTLELPNWMEKGVVFRLVGGLCLALVALTLALPWRETVSIPVTVMGASEPRSIVSPGRGVLATILVRDGARVPANTRLAYIGDTETIESIKRLEAYANDVTEAALHRVSLPLPPPVVVGGDLQTAYDTLATFAAEGQSQLLFGGDQERINQLEALIVSLQRQRQDAEKRKELVGPLIATSAERLEKLEGLGKDGWASAITIATAREKLAEHQISSARYSEELEQLGSQIAQTHSNLNQARLTKQLNSTNLHERARQASIKLLGSIKDWREQNTIITPVGGEIRFPIPLTIGHPLSVGDEFAIVVPVNRGFTAAGQVGSNSQADVKLGDEARLIINNYPSSKYGYIRGHVSYVSRVASSGRYSVHIRLPDKLLTSNNFSLDLRQRAPAMATITVRQGTVFEFLVGTLDSIFHNRT
jgi:hypothetical protein